VTATRALIRLGAVCVALVVTIGTGASASSDAGVTTTAAITIGGTVRCVTYGVKGIWIEVGTGNSGWASWSAISSHVATYRRTFTATVPTNIRLHIGCGGTPSSWWSDNRTGSTSRYWGPLSASKTLNARCNEGNIKPPVGVDNVRCSWGYPSGSGKYPNDGALCAHTGLRSGPCPRYDWGYRTGHTSCSSSEVKGYDGYCWKVISSRGFAYRNCTDYASWRLHLPYAWTHPLSAKYWASTPPPGYTKTSTPHIADIAVWTGGTFGHLAVVTGVKSDGSVIVEEYNKYRRGNAGVRPNASDTAPVKANVYLHR